MFKINKLKAEILSDKSENITDLYGFEFQFESGLNIIAGPNSRGKTTINTCIYYALGMEELLGAHNEKALDKALKEEFTIKPSQEEEGINYKAMRNCMHQKENQRVPRVQNIFSQKHEAYMFF